MIRAKDFLGFSGFAKYTHAQAQPLWNPSHSYNFTLLLGILNQARISSADAGLFCEMTFGFNLQSHLNLVIIQWTVYRAAENRKLARCVSFPFPFSSPSLPLLCPSLSLPMSIYFIQWDTVKQPVESRSL